MIMSMKTNLSKCFNEIYQPFLSTLSKYGTSIQYDKSVSAKAAHLHLGNSQTILYRAILPDLSFDK